MKDLKRAFGSPDAAFHAKIQETLFQIEEKEDAPVKKKLTLSMAFALIACILVVTMSAFAASSLFEEKPDMLAQPPEPTVSPMPIVTEPTAEVQEQTEVSTIATHIPDAGLVYLTTHGVYYHATSDCDGAPDAQQESLVKAIALCKQPCPACFPEDAVSLTVYLWNEEDPVYHAASECAYVTFSHEMPLAEAQKLEKTPCPYCIGSFDICLISMFSQYYHSPEQCGALKEMDTTEFTECTPYDALLGGKTACPGCIAAPVVHQAMTEEGKTFNRDEIDQETLYDAVLDSDHSFHLDADCVDISANSSLLSLRAALNHRLAPHDFSPCPTCTSGMLEEKYFASNRSDASYHINQSCAWLNDKSDPISQWDARSAGMEACQLCMPASFTVQHALLTIASRDFSPENGCSVKICSDDLLGVRPGIDP